MGLSKMRRMWRALEREPHPLLRPSAKVLARHAKILGSAGDPVVEDRHPPGANLAPRTNHPANGERTAETPDTPPFSQGDER